MQLDDEIFFMTLAGALAVAAASAPARPGKAAAIPGGFSPRQSFKSGELFQLQTQLVSSCTLQGVFIGGF